MGSNNFDWDLFEANRSSNSNINNNSNSSSTNNSGNTSPYNSSYGDISLMTTFKTSNSNNNNSISQNSSNTSLVEETVSPATAASTDPRFIVHTLTSKDTLQGLSLKYNVKVNDLKRANNLWTQDTLFIKKTLLIPIESMDTGSNNSGSIGGSPLNTSSNSISYKTSSSMNTGKSYDQDHNTLFPEFEPMAKSFSSPKEKPILPKRTANNNNNNGSFHSVPMSTLSFSPVVNSLDHKTQSQFSLLDEELNPL
ncbi:hypothetical protein CYY_008061 [Polysphondylium violaceum]|uniref:LysM domain-containing protein n=1 Tax=Polysphondylium violaceum TaxID=133409 RepID=A0A8J4V1N4_9MYCE|nr:hypothetical protein CYY_008061 [Polysphondylium violaceum]